MYDPDISELILDFIKEIQEAISEYKVTLWPESDLLVELHRREGKITEDDGHPHCGYYFVQHTRRCIYWLEEVKLNPTLSKALGLISGDLSGYQTRAPFMIDSRCTRNWSYLRVMPWGWILVRWLVICFIHRIQFSFRIYWNNFPTLQIATPDIYDYIVDTIMCMMTGEPFGQLNLSALLW